MPPTRDMAVILEIAALVPLLQVPSGHVRKHVDDRATGVLDEEAANTPGLVGERIHHAEPAPHHLSVGRVDRFGIPDIHTNRWLWILESRRFEDYLSRRVGG